MKNPTLLIDQVKFRDNALKLAEIFYKQNKIFHIITNGFCAHEALIEILAENGFTDFADSRLENFYVLSKFTKNGMLLRLPMLSEVSSVVDLCDISLNSEWSTICALSDAALVQQKIHRIILMLEMGDLREGATFSEAEEMIKKIVNLRGVRLAGIGANFLSYGGIIPEQDKMEELVNFVQRIEQRYGFELEFVSGGDSANLWLLEEGKLSPQVNHLRIGETFLTGRETTFHRSFGGLHHDVFSFRGEIIESKRKPSVPHGRVISQENAAKQFPDDGMLKRVILGFGSQDLNPATLVPEYKGIRYLGHAADQTIFDVTKFNKPVNVGDTLEFYLDYANIARLFTSPYVRKVLV